METHFQQLGASVNFSYLEMHLEYVQWYLAFINLTRRCVHFTLAPIYVAESGGNSAVTRRPV